MLPPFFITFHTYGTRLHGHHKGSVDRDHNEVGTPYLPEHQARHASAFSRLKHEPTVLTPEAAAVVEAAIRGVCEHRTWSLLAINVRSNHVHVVVDSNCEPERVMNDFKAWATRRLFEAGHFPKGHHVWARHGSTRWLNSKESYAGAIEYVEKMQG